MMKKKPVSTMMEENDRKELSEIASEQNQSKSQIIRIAIREYIHGGNNKPARALALVQLSSGIERLAEDMGNTAECDNINELRELVAILVKMERTGK